MTGTDFLLIVVICLLVYLVWKVGQIAPSADCDAKEAKELGEVEGRVLAMLTPSLVGKRCLVEMKIDGVSFFDEHQTSKAVLLDCDEEWILLEHDSAKRPFKRALRITQIKSISELT